MSSPDRGSAWVLTRALSPRDGVRAAAQLATGEILNEYDREWSVNEQPPSTTWAMYLSGDRRQFDYLCFDLDSSRGNAPYDAGRLSYWLDELNISHLICESGPTGGRHVWVGIDGAVDGDLVRDLAHLAGQLLPSLDPTPLLNPATGCVRPPGAPHRHGGVSVPLGALSALTNRTVTPEAVADLASFFVDAGAELPSPNLAIMHGMAVDADGHPYMIGPKRPLSARVEAMLHAPPAEDTSYTLAAVLAGCAHSRWRHADVLAVFSAPAFEHVRTMRGRKGASRIARSVQARIRVFDAAWENAVRYVASHPINGTGEDTDYLARSQNALAAVERAQERANAMPGLWGADRASSAARRSTGTHSTRAVLDALCLYIAQSAQLVVEADVRRLAADTGYGRTTVHTALRSLTRPLVHDDPDSAWIVRVGEPSFPHAQRYRLSGKFSTAREENNWTQGPARPRPTTHPQNRSHWLQRLSGGLKPLNRDVFAAPHSLGRTAGLVFKHLSTDASASVEDLTLRTGLDPSRVRASLHLLRFYRLARRGAGWSRGDDVAADAASTLLGVAGYLDRRRSRYGAERGRWEWWNAELTWMRKPNKKRRGRPSTTGVALFTQNDRAQYSRYPRGPDGRGAHREALLLVEAGILSPALTLAAA